ncbi:hypothetical protein EMIHUDRAFT_259305, partial [Emiliania huxleyi CCMP1516]|uniref:Uncharacterized protein n=2 Tax=Emiliania huxleyi TaxID=2903 RepID=A0A0D3I2N1_EMIH1
ESPFEEEARPDPDSELLSADDEGGEPSDAEEPSQAQDADADEVHEGAAATDEVRFAQLLRLAR